MKKRYTTEAVRCCKNNSLWRLTGKRWRPKKLETGAKLAGEARRAA